MSKVTIRKPKITGTRRILGWVNRVITGTQLIFAKRRVERFIIDKTKKRFEPLGSNPIAQRAPTGRVWKQRAESTPRKNPNRTHALFESGSLRDSIGVIRGRLNIASAVARGTAARTATAVVGVSESARNPQGGSLREIGSFLATGGVNPRGAVVPPRPFIGVSQKDADELDGTIQRIMNRLAR